MVDSQNIFQTFFTTNMTYLKGLLCGEADTMWLVCDRLGHFTGLLVFSELFPLKTVKLVPTTDPDSSSPMLALRVRFRQMEPARDPVVEATLRNVLSS